MGTQKHTLLNARFLGTRAGFTLVEVMISVTIAAIGTAAVFAAFLAQHRSYSSQSRSTEAYDQGRQAMDVIENSLMTAGYGVHPPIVFDFSRACGGGSASNCTSSAGVQTDCATQPCLDRSTAPDELVFYSRDPDPGASWYITAVSATSITLDFEDVVATDPLYNYAQLGVRQRVLRAGSVLLAVCEGASVSTYVTVQNGVSIATPTVGGDTVTLLAHDSTEPFQQNATLTGDACFTSGKARAFRVNRYHYYVRDFSGTPYLMLDNGIDNNNSGFPPDANDHIPVAAGIEDFQVAYVMADGVTVLGDQTTDAEPVRFADNATDLATVGGALYLSSGAPPTYNGVVWPSYEQDNADASRQTTAAANIRMVRISLSARSLEIDPILRNAPRDSKPTLENHDPSGADSFRRTAYAANVVVRNMLSRSQFDKP